MPGSSELLKPVLTLALGFALGLGAASHFGSAGGEGQADGSAAAAPASAAARSPEQLPTALESAVKDRIAVNAHSSDDSSLRESLAACGREPAAAGPTAEELAENEALDRAATIQGSPAEIDNMEPALNLETEGNAVSMSVQGDAGVPKQ